jgi:DNA modification methylase
MGYVYYSTKLGRMIHGDSLAGMRELEDASVDLVMTSPPFALVAKKDYGNVESEGYLQWFAPFAVEIRRILKPNGSFVIDIGGAWKRGLPVRNLYHFKLLIMLCEELGFYLAQEFYWWNPARLSSPATWVTVRRIRVKDAVDCVWWLSPTPWPKADNRRVLWPYSKRMLEELERGSAEKRRHPSGHVVDLSSYRDNGGSIPPNLLAIANTASNDGYLRYCREHGIPPHPARYPEELPEFFIRMLTDPGDLVVDPFAGSCVTGAVAERLGRRWICYEINEIYLRGAIGRFAARSSSASGSSRSRGQAYYKLFRPSAMWNNDAIVSFTGDGVGQQMSENEHETPSRGTGRDSTSTVCVQSADGCSDL